MISHIYCDMDGVLVDLDGKMQKQFGLTMDEYLNRFDSTTEGWKSLNEEPHFWYNIGWTKDGKTLWNYLKNTNIPVSLLTTPVMLVKNCKKDKERWAKDKIGNVNVLFAYKKERYASPSTILIDDKQKNVDKFVQAGGIGILHENAKTTIQKIKSVLEKNKSAGLEWKGKYLSVHTTDSGYEYIVDKPGVIVIPIHAILSTLQLMLIYEPNQFTNSPYTVITGTKEEDESSKECAIRELAEEVGYTVEEENVFYLGKIYPSKAHASYNEVFIAITNSMQPDTETNPDDSHEAKITPQWISFDDMFTVLGKITDGIALSSLGLFFGSLDRINSIL